MRLAASRSNKNTITWKVLAVLRANEIHNNNIFLFRKVYDADSFISKELLTSFKTINFRNKHSFLKWVTTLQMASHINKTFVFIFKTQPICGKMFFKKVSNSFKIYLKIAFLRSLYLLTSRINRYCQYQILL